MAQVDSENTTAMPANTTRRRLLTIAAGGAVAAVIPTATLTAAPALDPIYAAIKRHRDLAKICEAAWKVRARCKDFGTLTEEEKAHVLKLNDAVDEAHLPLETAAMDLFNTAPTTHAGIIAALRYMRIQYGDDGEHMIQGWLEDEDGDRYIDWRDAWLDTLIDAVDELGKAVLS
jgi:hypothetical protein